MPADPGTDNQRLYYKTIIYNGDVIQDDFLIVIEDGERLKVQVQVENHCKGELAAADLRVALGIESRGQMQAKVAINKFLKLLKPP